jgi:hypothetical protein
MPLRKNSRKASPIDATANVATTDIMADIIRSATESVTVTLTMRNAFVKPASAKVKKSIPPSALTLKRTLTI